MLKQWRVALILMIAIAMAIFVSACGGSSGSGGNTGSGSTPTATTASGSTGPGPGTPGAYNCVSGTLNVTGSTALQPLVTAVAKDYQGKCSSANITVGPGGSKKGLSDAESGASGVGDSDVFASSSQSDLVDHQVAVVVFCLVVNPSVSGVTNLTTAQIVSIYTGKTTNWNQVGGPNQPIVVVSRPASSGTRATFKQYILSGQNESPAQAKSLTVDSTGTVLQTVEQTPGSIGYVTTGAAAGEGSKVTVLNIDGNTPTADMAKNNTYKFWNIEHMYTKGPATGVAQALIDYMGSASAKSIAESQKFILVSDMSADALQAHQPKS